MSNNQNENMQNPVSKIELAAWAVASEPIDNTAVERVKEAAKRLASETVADDRDRTLEPGSLQKQRRGSSRAVSWLIRGGVAAAIAGVIFATTLMPGSESAAFAAALKKLDLVKVFSFDQVIHAENLPTPAKNHVVVCEDGRSRSELDGVVSVNDATGARRITLIESERMAIVSPAVEGLADFDQLTWLKELKNLNNETTKDLGEKEIDGVKAFGKEVVVNKYRFQIWVDAKAEELVLVEHFFPEDSPIEKAVVRNLNFDEEADETLFSFEVPDGYEAMDTNAEIVRLVHDPEQNAIELMQGHADLADGKFPVSLGDWSDWMDVLSIDGKVNEELAGKLGALLPFLSSMREKDFAYLGDGVTLNQKERVIVFWYKNEEGKFRAIYSDLTAGEIKESDLPE
jgi:hypothetical protein